MAGAMSAATYSTPWPGAARVTRRPAAGDVEHAGAGGQLTDHIGSGVQQPQVAAQTGAPEGTARAGVLDRPVVDRAHSGSSPPRPTRGSRASRPSSRATRSISRGTPKRVDEVAARAGGSCGTGR